MNKLLPILLAAAASLLPSPSRAGQLPWPIAGNLRLSPPAMLTTPREGDVLRDVFVVPMRAGQNRVPYWDYDWKTYEFNTERGGGGVRLYFYERERGAASYAVASIRDQYVRLTDQLHYLPRTTVPFILYASYAEFQATNVFMVAEGTLGATDPRDLRMAMPFFGNVHQFSRVSTHEMAHQLTVQKIRDVAAAAHVPNPLAAYPLWFIEGLAEWATFDGIDPEGDYILRDLLTNPDAGKGYALPDFFNQTAGGYIGVYKLGQARLTFVAEVYGRQKVIDLLERAAELAGAASPDAAKDEPKPPGPPRPEDAEREREREREEAEQAAAQPEQKDPKEEGLPEDAQVEPPAPGRLRSFDDYVARVLGEPPQKISAKYEAWLKKRYFGDYLQARQSVADFVNYKAVHGEPDSITVSEDGRLLLYRTVERETGLSALHLQDMRDPSSRVTVARDQRPGLESLHPVDRRVTALRADTLLFAARSGQDDKIFVQHIERKEKVKDGRVRVDLDLSSRDEFDLGEILEVYDPALSPDGKQAVFAGIDPGGFRDLYLLALDGPDKGKLTRLTNDVWSESDLAWDGGRLLFVSDQTETHEPNVFAFDLQKRTAERLVPDAHEQRRPVPALGGVVFRSLESGKPDLWLFKDGVRKRLTDTSSAVLAAEPVRGNALVAVIFHSGTHQLFRIPNTALLMEDAPKPVPEAGLGGIAEGPQAQPTNGGTGGTGLGVAQNLDYPRADLPDNPADYQPGKSRNWRVEATAGALVGPTSVGAAALAITDLMRDHLLLVNLAIYGSLKLTDALAFYVNQSQRPELGVGAFHTFSPRRDKTFRDVDNFFLQREFGVAGLLRYPFDRFRRFEATAQVQGVERFAFTDNDGTLLDQWQGLNGGVEPELVGTLSFGVDTMRLHALAGPVEGSSLLTSGSVGYLPVRRFAYARLMVDAQQRVRLVGRTNVLLRAATGLSTGGRFSPQFFLGNVDNLEGFRFGDTRLLGDHFYVANFRVNLPIDWLVQIPLFTAMYGVAGFDFGGTFDLPEDAWDRRSLSGVLGTDVALGALVLQLHFGKLIDIGGEVGKEPWVFNLNFRYLYF